MHHEMDPADLETLAASLEKPLPNEPSPWVRLPATWRQWSWSGLGWFAIGVFVLLWVVPRPAGGTDPAGVLWPCAVVAAVWIAATVRGGLVDRVLAARLAAAQRRHPHEPWFWDHRWDPSGVSGSPVRRLLRSRPVIYPLLINALMFSVIGPPLPAVRWLWGTIAGCVVTWMAWRAWRIWGVGTAHVSFAKFPFHPGERVTLHFGMSEGGAQFERVSFCLRRIHESRSDAFSRPIAAMWRHGLRENRPPGELPGGNHFVTLEFDVPESAQGTHLSAPRPEYWALDVLANTSAGPYVESLLVPIYERPVA